MKKKGQSTEFFRDYTWLILIVILVAGFLWVYLDDKQPQFKITKEECRDVRESVIWHLLVKDGLNLRNIEEIRWFDTYGDPLNVEEVHIKYKECKQVEVEEIEINQKVEQCIETQSDSLGRIITLTNDCDYYQQFGVSCLNEYSSDTHRCLFEYPNNFVLEKISINDLSMGWLDENCKENMNKFTSCISNLEADVKQGVCYYKFYDCGDYSIEVIK